MGTMFVTIGRTLMGMMGMMGMSGGWSICSRIAVLCTQTNERIDVEWLDWVGCESR